MALIPTKNKVNFVHFNGKESEWNLRISGNNWTNSIVFGKVWDASFNCNMKIYAGKDSIDSSDYIYDMTSIEKMVEVETKIGDILNFLAVDASNYFTNEYMKEALENFISRDSSTVIEIENYIKGLDSKIENLDISVNLINTILQETIHWMDENGKWIEE